MEYGNFQFRLFHTVLRSKFFFLRRSHEMFLQLCVVVVVLEACLFNTQSHFTRTTFHSRCFVTPLDLHNRHHSCVLDRVG